MNALPAIDWRRIDARVFRPTAPSPEPDALPGWAPNPCRGCNGAPGGCDLCEHTGQGPQGAFMAAHTDILGYGGAAGGGKTSSAAIKPALFWADNPDFYGLLFRRTRPEAVDSLWREIEGHYPAIIRNARPTSNNLTARFPSGGKIRCAYLEKPAHRTRYQGGGYQYVAFDEASHFSEDDVRYLFTRQRSASGIPSQLVLASNPGGPGHDWLFRWFAPWLDPTFPDPARPREVRYFVDGHNNDGRPIFVWYHPDGRLYRQDDPDVRSITFIPARLADNQKMAEHDPGYRLRLNAVDAILRRQLLDGDWLAKPPGNGRVYMFDRAVCRGSFARRMGTPDLVTAIQAAFSQGWQCTLGIDHGIGPRREVAHVILWSDRLQEAWVVGTYLNPKKTTTRADAIGIRRLLDRLGIDPRRVTRAHGDVGNVGKGKEPTDGNVARDINSQLATEVDENGNRYLGFAIGLPDKTAGSIDRGVTALNSAFDYTSSAGHLYLEDSCTDLADALESWIGGEPYKDPVDALRYGFTWIAQSWAYARPGVGGYAEL